MSTVKRIAVLTTSTSQPMMIQAVYKDGMLTFGKLKSLPVSRMALHATAVPILAALVARGFTVLVDERDGSLSRLSGAQHITFGTKFATGEPMIVMAFNLVREMKRQHAIIPPEDNPSGFDVPDTVVNEVYSQSGDISYRVDWENLRTEHYLTLLAAYATVHNAVGTAAYIRAVMGGTEPEKKMPDPLSAIVAHEQARAEAHMQPSLTGTRPDENTWIF